MSNCIYNDDYDVETEVFREQLRRARKPYKCCECGETIQPGDLYEHITGKWEGEWGTYRTCARCVNVAADFFRGRVIEYMVQDFRETHGFDYRDGIPADFAPCGRSPVPADQEPRNP